MSATSITPATDLSEIFFPEQSATGLYETTDVMGEETESRGSGADTGGYGGGAVCCAVAIAVVVVVVVVLWTQYGIDGDDENHRSTPVWDTPISGRWS